jgi:CHASE2 domain-containing sensor protein
MRQLTDRIVTWAKRDRKQAGLMVALLAVGLLLWGRLLLKQVPQTASADDKPAWLEEVELEPADPDRPRETVRLRRPGEPTRDPFRLDVQKYPRTLSEDSVLSEAKSEEQLTDEDLRMTVVRAAEGLRLQSLTQGEVPAAFISGRLVRVGQTIEGFTLLACDERSAVLEKHGIRVRLGMGSTRRQ